MCERLRGLLAVDPTVGETEREEQNLVIGEKVKNEKYGANCAGGKK